MRPISASDQVCVSIVTDMHNHNKPLSAMAGVLNAMGFTSKKGLLLSESHISNFMHDDLGLRKMGEHTKPFYAEWNHVAVVEAKKVGIWDIKKRIDRNVTGRKVASHWLTNDDWSKIAAAGPEWISKFHRYVLHLATND